MLQEYKTIFVDITCTLLNAIKNLKCLTVNNMNKMAKNVSVRVYNLNSTDLEFKLTQHIDLTYFLLLSFYLCYDLSIENRRIHISTMMTIFGQVYHQFLLLIKIRKIDTSASLQNFVIWTPANRNRQKNTQGCLIKIKQYLLRTLKCEINLDISWYKIVKKLKKLCWLLWIIQNAVFLLRKPINLLVNLC